MSELNLEELNRSLEDSTGQLDRFTNGVRGTTASTGILSAANRRATDSLNQEALSRAKYKKNFSDGLDQVSRTALDLASSLAQGNTSFTVLNGVIDIGIKAVTGVTSGILNLIPGFGGALSKGAEVAGQAAGEIAKVMISQFQVGWDAYRQVSDSGIVKSFGDLKSLSNATGLRFEQIGTVLGKYSGTLASFNSQLKFGANGFKQLSNTSASLRASMYTMGINAQDFTEFQAKYIDEQNRLGQLQGKDMNKLVAGTKNYIEELDLQAKLFGLSRKEAQSARDIALSEDKFRASMNVISRQISDPVVAERIKESALKFNSSLAKQAPTVAAGMRDLFAGNGTSTSDVANELQAATGGEAGRIAAKLRSGEIDEIEARNRLITSIEANNKANASAVQYSNKSVALKGFAERENLAASGKLTAEEVKTAKASIGATDGTTEALASTAQALEAASQELQDLATSSETMLKVMGFLSKSIKDLVSNLRKEFGGGGNSVVDKAEGNYGTMVQKGDRLGGLANTTATSQKVARAARAETIKSASAVSAYNELKGGRIGKKEAKNILDSGNERDITDFGGREILEKIASGKVTQEAGNREAVEKLTASRNTPKSGGDTGAAARAATAKPTGAGAAKAEPTGAATAPPAGAATAEPTGATTDDSALGAGTRLDAKGNIDVFIGKLLRKGGSVAWRTNNPGNLNYGELTKKHGALAAFKNPNGDEQQKKYGIAIMPTLADGENAQLELWQTPQYKRLSIAAAVNLWKSGWASDKPSDYAESLAKAAGVEVTTKVKQLSEAQLKNVAQKQRHWEGFQEGEIAKARTGGIFRGPSTGYLTELSGDKAVIPANDGVTKQALNTATMDQGQDVRLLQELYGIMDSKFNQMISLLDVSDGYQAKLLRTMQ
jgi:hypothetical protein